MKQSAGLLLYQQFPLRVLIVHPSGHPDIPGSWSIPKGEFTSDETPEDAARREFREECGIAAPEKLFSLGSVIYKSGKKRVFCFAGLGPEKVGKLSWEIDRAEYVDAEVAEQRLHPAQSEFVRELQKNL